MMVIAIGLSSYNIALFHLVNHAFYISAPATANLRSLAQGKYKQITSLFPALNPNFCKSKYREHVKFDCMLEHLESFQDNQQGSY